MIRSKLPKQYLIRLEKAASLAATDAAETMFGESYARQLHKITLLNNIVGGRISNISENSNKTSHFALYVDEATDIVKHAFNYLRSIHVRKGYKGGVVFLQTY